MKAPEIRRCGNSTQLNDGGAQPVGPVGSFARWPRAGSFVASLSVDRPAQNIIAGKYNLLRKLGQGGMGSVWYAEHLTLRSPVAIKLIDPSIADSPEALGRFLREAQAAASLRSPVESAVTAAHAAPKEKPRRTPVTTHSQSVPRPTAAPRPAVAPPAPEAPPAAPKPAPADTRVNLGI